MSVTNKFEQFNKKVRTSSSDKEKISRRYKQITKRLNIDFWNSESEINHSLYVGSYGRDTDIHISDIDVLFRLPYSVYERYNNYEGNSQSSLLQDIKSSLQKTYSTSHLKSDGQIIGIKFNDGISFEIVPCFVNKDDSYTYPDTNNGGSWKTTNPKPEILEIREKNKKWNYNLKELCRMVRVWKDYWDVPMGGLLIDTLAYNFLKDWKYRDKSYTYHDWMIRDFLKYLKNQDKNKSFWLAVGSNQYVWRKGKFEFKSLRCYNIALKAIDHEENQMPYSANSKWREIFGTKF
ncbi:nucleotidyltransferase [Patescibacteria group bacterium]